MNSDAASDTLGIRKGIKESSTMQKIVRGVEGKYREWRTRAPSSISSENSPHTDKRYDLVLQLIDL